MNLTSFTKRLNYILKCSIVIVRVASVAECIKLKKNATQKNSESERSYNLRISTLILFRYLTDISLGISSHPMSNSIAPTTPTFSPEGRNKGQAISSSTRKRTDGRQYFAQLCR